MKIKIVYFAYLNPGVWEPIFLEQLSQLKNCGLYDLADIIFSYKRNDIRIKK